MISEIVGGVCGSARRVEDGRRGLRLLRDWPTASSPDRADIAMPENGTGFAFRRAADGPTVRGGPADAGNVPRGGGTWRPKSGGGPRYRRPVFRP